MVDGEGKKILLSKVPAAEVEKQKKSQNRAEAMEMKRCEGMSADFQCRQQIDMEVAHKKNIREIMELIKNNTGALIKFK